MSEQATTRTPQVETLTYRHVEYEVWTEGGIWLGKCDDIGGVARADSRESIVTLMEFGIESEIEDTEDED